MTFQRTILGSFSMLAMMAGLAAAQQPMTPSSATRQSMDDAWWTGPMLAPFAATLPRGHFLIEPYLYDVTMQGRFDSDGVRRSGLADEPISRNGISRGASLGRTP